MPRGFPLQDTGPGMNGLFHDLAVEQAEQADREQNCPGHVASERNPKICGRCGCHIDSLRPDDDDRLRATCMCGSPMKGPRCTDHRGALPVLSQWDAGIRGAK